MATHIVKRFLKLESASGLILLISACIAMIWANSPLAYIHTRFIENALFTINEGLMAFFFLLVGLELKRNYVEGNFSDRTQIMLPLVASIGGMLVPIALYILINYHDPIAIQGWATPAATDIAFALGVLSLFGSRIRIELKLFLLSVAIFDDVGAILIIATYFSHGFAYLYLLGTAIVLAFLFLANRLAIQSIVFYLIMGVLLWFALYRSGIHPTLTGVILAFFIPSSRPIRRSPFFKLEQFLHPIVAYFIMPLFALANAGITFNEITKEIMTSGVVIGTAVGLFVGKQLGVFGVAFLWIKLGFSRLPKGTSWTMLYGVAILCGIGFTMSLFLGTLSFHNEDIYLAEVRLGVIIGSILSGILGAYVLWAFGLRRRTKE